MLFAPNDTLGTIITGLNTITGSTFITLLFLMTICIFFFIALNSSLGFGMPFEASVILILPLHIAILAYVSNWMPVAGSFIIFLGIIIAKNILNR